MDIIFAEKELELDSGLILGLDVESVTQVTPELLEDNEAALDELEDVCVHLIDAEIKDDTENPIELLRVAQLALEYRSYLWDVERREREEDNLEASDKIRALEKKLSVQGGEDTPRDAVTPRSTPRHQLQKYVDMVEKLEGELDELRYGSETLASDLDAKRAEYEALEDDHTALDKEFTALKLKLEKMDLEFEANNAETVELKEELTREKKQNHYLQAELEKTKKGATRNRGRASVAQDEIGALKHQIDQLETERKALQGEVVQQANEVLSINGLLQSTEEQVDAKNRDLVQYEKERDAARGQVAALQMEIEEKDDSIRQVIEHQKHQVQQWAEECAALKADAEEKDNTILDLQADLKKLRDNARERTLQAEIEKRDMVVNGKQKSIELLEDQLETKELELLQWAKNYKAFEEESAQRMAAALEEQYEHYKEMEMDAERKIRENDQLQEMADQAVQQNIESETELLEVKSRMDQYERGTWGLFEAINEIKKLKEQARKHEFVEQEARKKIINEKEKVAKMYQENQFLRQKAGIPDEQLIDHSQLNVEVHRKQQRLIAKNELLLREIERLEDERLELKDQLLHEADCRADLGVNRLGLNVRCQQILGDFAVKLRQEGEEAVPLNDRSLELKQRVRELENENDRLVLQLHDIKLNNADEPRAPPAESAEATAGSDKTEAYFQELVTLLKTAGTPGAPGSGVPSSELQQQLERREEQVRELQKQLDSLRPDSLQAVIVVDTQIGADDQEYARQLEGTLSQAVGAGEDQLKVGFVEKVAGHGHSLGLHILIKGALNDEQKPAEELLARLKSFVDSSDSTRVVPGLNRTASMERLEHKCSSTPAVASTLFGMPQATAMPKMHAHLMEVLQLLDQRERELATLQVEMELYHTKFLHLNDNHVHLVRQHLAAKVNWERSLQVNKESEERAQAELGKAKIELQEMEELKKVITMDDPEGLKGVASSALRKSTLAQISEIELYRRHNTLKAQHKIVDSELQTVRTELRRTEESLGEKLARLTQQFEVSESRVSLCMGELQGSVTQSEFDRVSELCVAINAKYCAQLDRERALTIQVRDSSQLAREVDHLKVKLNKAETELQIVTSERANYKEALDRLGEDDGVETEVSKLRTEVMQLRAAESSASTRAEINESNHKSILEANENLRVKLEARLADVEAEVIQLSNRIRHEQELAEQLSTKFSGGLPRDQAQKLTDELRALQKRNDTLTVDVHTYKSVAELGTNQLKELQSYYLSQVEQVRSLNASLEEFSAGGDVESQLARALLESTTTRVKKTQLERRLAKAESEADFRAEREAQLNQVLDAKRVVVFKLQTLLRGIKVRYEQELQSARMEVVSRPTENTVEAWNEALHKARSERDAYEVDAFNARLREEEHLSELEGLKGKSDSFSSLIASLSNASTPLDVKITELSQQVQDLAVSESGLKRVELRLNKQLAFQQELQKESEETTLRLESEVAEKNTMMQGLRDEAKALRFDNMQLQSMATLLELLKQDKISETEFKQSLAQTRKAQEAAQTTPGGDGMQEETAGGVSLQEEMMARKARREARRQRKQAAAEAAAVQAARPVKSCCLTIDKDFNEIPEGSEERNKFCAAFMKDLCASLGITEDCVTLGMLAEGSVIVPFALRAPEGQSLDSVYDNLVTQMNDPSSKLRSGTVTGALNPEKSKERMESALGQQAPKSQVTPEDLEEEDEEDDFPVMATQSDSGALGSAAPTAPVHGAVHTIDQSKFTALQQQVVFYEDKIEALDSENAKYRRQCAAEQKKVTRLQDVITAQENDMRQMASGKGGNSIQQEMAAETIDSLQARLSKKDKAMRAMRDRLELAETDMLAQKNLYEEQLAAMNERLNDIDNARLRKLTDKLHKLDHTEEPGDETVELTELGKQEIAARDKMITRLQNDIERVEDENRQFEGLIAEKNKEIDELEWQVQTLKDRPAAVAPVVIEKPKPRRAPKEAAELAEVKKENKTLRDANKQLQIKMLEAAEAAAKRPAEPQNELQRRMVDEATSQMAQRLQSLHERSQRMKSELERMKESNGELMAQAEDSTKRLSEVRKANEALVNEKAELQSEMAKLRQKSSSKGEASDDMASKHRSLMQAYKTLKGKHQELQLMLEETEERANKNTTAPAQATKTDVAVERWEKEKKLQRTIDSLKTKLAAKQTELEDAGKTTTRLKTELTAATSRPAERPSSRPARSANSSSGQVLEELGSVLELKQQLLRSEEAREEAEKKELVAAAKIESLSRDKIRAEEKLEMAARLQSVMGGSTAAPSDGATVTEVQRRLTEAQDQVTNLQFDLEASKHNIERQAQHIATLETAIAAMQSMGLSQQQSRNTLEAKGSSTAKDRDLQKVVEGLNEVVASLQAENDSLKHKADNFSEALASAKALRGKCAKLEAENKKIAEKDDKISELEGRVSKLNEIGLRTAKQLKKQTESTEKLRALVKELNSSKESLARDLEHAEQQLNAGMQDRSEQQSLQSSHEREKRVLEDSLIALQDKNRRLESQLERWRKELKDAKNESGLLRDTVEELRNGEVAVASELAAAQAGQQSMQQLMAEVSKLKQLAKQLQDENTRLARHQMPAGGSGVDEAVKLKIRKLEEENRDLRSELSSFDPAFWEEIEDLKYREHEAKQLNKRYESMLSQLSQQYGFPFKPRASGR